MNKDYFYSMKIIDSSYYARFINSWIESMVLPSYPVGLYEPIKYMLGSGGKRIRPTLLCATAVAWGSTCEKVKPQALAIEMFHNFTLLHDDVMDNADVRHGRPTVHIKWNVPTAILSGDTMLTLATRLVTTCDEDKATPALQLFNKTAIEIYEGQQLDMNFESRDDVTEAEYMEMIRLKTGVLLGCACRMGVLMAGGDDRQQQYMYDFGVNMGLAFQLRDDFLDTFGDPEVFGKAIGGDILNDKKTWLRIQAGLLRPQELAHLSSEYKDAEKIEHITNLYKNLRLDELCTSMIEQYTHRAISCIDNVEMPLIEFKQFFKDMALSAMNRMH